MVLLIWRLHAVVLCAVLCGSLAGCQSGEQASDPDPGTRGAVPEVYLTKLQEHRANREERLRSPDGWLALVGLHWLQPGDNPFAVAADGGNLLFPRENGDPVPEDARELGAFAWEGESVSVKAVPGAGLQLDAVEGEEPGVLPAGEAVPLLDDAAEGGPSTLVFDNLSFYIIRRGEQVGVRVKSSVAPALVEFHGLDYFPVDLSWKIEAHFEPYETPKTVGIPNVLGTVYEEQVAGAVVFEAAGETYRIEPIVEVDGTFFLIFADTTNGKETYGAGRFLYADPPDAEGRVNLDFNYAYNPPCAFSPYATCPLPPKENKLPIPIEAGEKKYGEHH